MRGRILAAILMCGFATPGVAGDKGVGVPPAPRNLDAKTIESWISRYIELEDGNWGFLTHSDTAAYFLSPDTMDLTKSGTIKFWYRMEYFAADVSEDSVTRSAYVLEELDCNDERYRTLAVDTYPQNNLGGEKFGADEADAEWSFARPQTVAHLMGESVCEYVDKVIEEAKNAEAGKTGAAPTVRSHF